MPNMNLSAIRSEGPLLQLLLLCCCTVTRSSVDGCQRLPTAMYNLEEAATANSG